MNLKDRKYIVIGFFIAIGIIYSIRLFYIQVINNEFKIDSNTNVVRKEVLYPSRGLIYDRENKLLVYNEAAYDLMVVPGQLKPMDTLKLCNLLEIEKEAFIEKINKAKAYSIYKASVFEKEISSDVYAQLQEILFEYKGFYVQTRTLRKYPFKTAAHVLGYIGEVSESEINRNEYYKSGDYIGKSGIEKSYEELLRGKRGVKHVLVDVHNREKGKYKDGMFDTLAISGTNLTLTIDAELQNYGERLMNNKLGSIVAIEPKTGEILAMVSSPTYDPNLLVGRAIKKNYPVLLHDSLKPLFNRATMAQYPPGSIFKIIQSLIALDEKVITPNTGFQCIKSLVGCHNHPSATNVTDAIKMSCNPYFYQVFKRLIQQNKAKSIFKDSEIGLRKWSNKVKKFGLGVDLAIDFPGVKKGFIPDVEFYDKWYGHGRWAFSTIYSLSIGQGEIGVVPVQMANLAAIIANKGYYITPHFIKKIADKDTIPEQFTKKHFTGIDTSYFKYIHDGMQAVVYEPGGTARRARINNEEIIVCGKTGTAENPHGEDHSIFIAFAPRKDPKIAIAVYIENAGFGGTWAAPTASLMIEKYLTDSISDPLKEKRILEANLIPEKIK